jgi:hypothetical protein
MAEVVVANKDQEFAERLHAELQAKGVRCWFSPEDMKIGDKIWDRLDQSIQLNAVACDEQFFVLPGSIMLGNINHFYGSSYRSERPSSMPCVNYGPLTCYEDNWDVFDQPEQSAP